MMADQAPENDVVGLMRLFIDGTLEDIERHLGLPQGAVAGISKDEDYMLLLKLIAVVEPVLNDLIRLGFTRSNGGLGGRDRREILADAIGQLEKLPLDG